MKFNAITHEPSRLKDYVDIYFLLERKNLNEITSAFLAKYANVSADMAHRTILYHDELDKKTPVQLLKPHSFSFEEMANRLHRAVQDPSRRAIPLVDKIAFEAKWKKFQDEAPDVPTQKKRRGKHL